MARSFMPSSRGRAGPLVLNRRWSYPGNSMTRMAVLTTERLVLREMTAADLDHIAARGGQDRAQAREAGHRVRQRADHLRRGHLTTVGDDVRFPPAASACLRLNQEVAPDFDTCYRAVVARDSRFDGRFFTGVTST